MPFWLQQAGDLKRLLDMYVSWQQRVLPFSTFDAFVEALEKLGSSYVLKVSPKHAAAVLLTLPCMVIVKL